MNESIEIRLFQDGDSIAELTALLHRAYGQLAELGLRYHAAWQDDAITQERIDGAECYLALVGDELVGTLTFSDAARVRGCPWYDRPDVASFGQLGVEPAFQGRGIGRLLVETAERRAAETGAAELAVDTAEPAQHLIDWYARRGYRFIEYADWSPTRGTNYRSVILSLSVSR